MKHIVIRMPEEKWNDVLEVAKHRPKTPVCGHMIDLYDFLARHVIYYSDDDLVEFAGSYSEDWVMTKMMDEERLEGWHEGYDKGRADALDETAERDAGASI